VATTFNIPNCDVAIMARIVQPERGDLSLAAAKAMLKFAFVQSDRERAHALLQKAQAGMLTDAEQAEIDDYERVGYLLGIIHAKARKALKKSKRTSA
jgi:hypothetical protein